MARPASGYRTADGKRVVGATTPAGMIDDPGGLIYWAWNEGREGRDYRESRDSAADAGSTIHKMVEQWFRGDDPWAVPIPENVDGAAVHEGFTGFLSWAKGTKLEVIEQEVSLVSEEHRFGGTFDALARCDGKVALIDWKTGKDVYPKVVLQLAAYRALLAENRPELTVESVHVVLFNRESGGFTHKGIPMALVEKGWHAFLLAKQLYEYRKEIKRGL